MLRCDIRYNSLFLQHIETAMPYQTDDLRIKEIKELVSPAKVLGELPTLPPRRWPKRVWRFIALFTARMTGC